MNKLQRNNLTLTNPSPPKKLDTPMMRKAVIDQSVLLEI